MTHLIHPNFLQDRGAYAAAQCYWETLWKDILSAKEVEFPWELEWMRNPGADGNPIFTAVCWPLHRGVRIIQEEPGDPENVDLDWWLDYFGDQTDPDAVRELVIACCPSAENLAAIKQLLSQWVEKGEVPL